MRTEGDGGTVLLSPEEPSPVTRIIKKRANREFLPGSLSCSLVVWEAYSPQASHKASTLSRASQVNSGSSRPK